MIQYQDNNDIIENSDNIDSNINHDIKGLDKFTDLINGNNELQGYVKELEKIIASLNDKCSDIILQKIDKDFSFEFNIHVIKEKQSDLFTQVLDMKNTNKLLSEINISMESLENILTKL